jgi:ATP-dependent DNA helicase RecG
MAKRRMKTYTSRELMELAVTEGERSIPEHNDKEDPFVGAIVATKDGEILAKAHRGELREGEHCEFTLLERKLRDQSLLDYVLYVTLEPCTDEARTGKRGKRGCATHIVRARIGTVYVGIEDPNPLIANLGIRYLIASGVVVHPFDLDLEERIRQRNSKFIREKEEEAKVLPLGVAKKEEKTLLEQAKPSASIAGLSEELLQKFINLSGLPYTYHSNEFNVWATDFGLLEKDERTGNYKPTGLGMMLFGKQPSHLYPQVVFKIEVNYGVGEPEIRDIVAPLVSQWPEIFEYIRDKALKLTIDRSGKERAEVSDFPIDVIREAVVNAIIHRDYSIEGATNYLYIDSEKIIVRSPGFVAPPISVEDLKEFKASPHSRNPKIMFVFNQMKLAEQRGKGMRSMKELPSIGFPLPMFEMQGGNLIVSFARNSSATGTAGMSGREYKELLYIQAHEPVTRVQFAKHFKLPDRTAKAHLESLVDSGKIEPVGRGKATKYVSRKR